jgi:hypothetical protein
LIIFRAPLVANLRDPEYKKEENNMSIDSDLQLERCDGVLIICNLQQWRFYI